MPTSSNEPPAFKQTKILTLQRWIIVGLTAVVAILFILGGYLVAGEGYPLDDAWIHQTYARNFAETGRWFFIPGVESGGSTSPLWTIVLGMGYRLPILSPFFWTSFFSILFLSAASLIGFEIIRKKCEKLDWWTLTGGLWLGLEWHLQWSASSGMETILFCFFSLLLFFLLIDYRRPVLIGLIIGLMVWVRPDGVTLLGPVILITIWKVLKKQINMLVILKVVIPVATLFVFYGLFNYYISGKLLPNTFYAKQIEYAVVLQQPLIKRLVRMFTVPISGAGIFLLPGVIWMVWQAIMKRDMWTIGVFLWVIGYGALFALKLPMNYQHGRYLIPLIPAFFMLGITGSISMARKYRSGNAQRGRFLFFLWSGCGIMMILFGFFGQQALIKDIKTINRLMVEPAQWINRNTKETDLIAAHDIGALGYFGNRDMIDLAGLIQPEIQPIIRDEEKIMQYLIDKKVDYLIVLSGWYPKMADFGVLQKEFEFEQDNRTELMEIRRLNSAMNY